MICLKTLENKYDFIMRQFQQEQESYKVYLCFIRFQKSTGQILSIKFRDKSFDLQQLANFVRQSNLNFLIRFKDFASFNKKYVIVEQYVSNQDSLKFHIFSHYSHIDHSFFNQLHMLLKYLNQAMQEQKLHYNFLDSSIIFLIDNSIKINLLSMKLKKEIIYQKQIQQFINKLYDESKKIEKITQCKKANHNRSNTQISINKIELIRKLIDNLKLLNNKQNGIVKKIVSQIVQEYKNKQPQDFQKNFQ